MTKVKYYVDNPAFMELIDELATQITEMQYKEQAYQVTSGELLIFNEKAQDFYNEKYDEFEGLLNKFKIHSNNDLNDEQQ